MVPSSWQDVDRGRSTERTREATEFREFAWRWVWLALVIGGCAGVTVTVLLWGGTPGDHRDALDKGWRSAASVLAVLATLLGVSRLRLSQREHRRQLAADHAVREEATARHITELASQAGEQLGSPHAATRIGALAALERLAETYPGLRQTVVDQICSYLRRPFHPPPERVRTLTQATAAPIEADGGRDGHGIAAHDAVVADRQELDVRRTAQEILRQHLWWPAAIPDAPATFWDGIAVDLRDAVLVEFNLGHCRMGFVDLTDTDLHGSATFTEAVFTSAARFDGARFGGKAGFSRATFQRRAEFSNVTFGGNAVFEGAKFRGDASFKHTIFVGDADFGGWRYFLGGGCPYHGPEKIETPGAAFHGAAVFQRAIFGGRADFRETHFAGPPFFQEATFENAADFHDATFTYTSQNTITTYFPETSPEAAVTVDFSYAFMLYDIRLIQPDTFHSWPPGWKIMSPDADPPARLVYAFWEPHAV
ncbi:MAG TPA: pentapeptide repeat-containing protein [Streptosporangiaceae bacterium]|nr:pentapeptide repeat-containing protein [Streptosporangiaceae bacterium]